MSLKSGAVLYSALLFSHGAAIQAAEEPESGTIDASNKEWLIETVESLGKCSGYFEFMSDLVKTEKPATSTQLHNTANGARMAAAYMLYLEYAATHDDVKALGDFFHHPEGRADVHRTQMAMYLENGDTASIVAEGKRCTNQLPMQEEILKQLRDDALDRK